MLSYVVALLALSSCCGQEKIPVFVDVADWCEYCQHFQTSLWSSFQKGFGEMVKFNVYYGDSTNKDLIDWTACAQNVLAPANSASDYTWFGVTECVDKSGFSGTKKTTTQCVKEIGMDQSDATKVQSCMKDSATVAKYVQDMESQFKKTAGKYIPQAYVKGKELSDYSTTVKDVCNDWTGTKPAACSSAERKCARADGHAYDQSIVDEVNRVGQWTAGVNEVFRGKTLDSIRRLMGTHTKKANSTVDPTPLVGAPDSFDPRTQWPQCKSMKQIRNQAECGSCWAFGAVEAFTDRYCVATKQAENPILSAENLVSCDQDDSGCNGGESYTAWNFFKNEGIPTETCQPYTIPTCPPSQQPCMNFKPTPKCSKICYGTTNQTISKRYYISSVTSAMRGVADIQQELMTNGPVEVDFTVYADFVHYKSGVYSHTSGQALGGHAVKLLGWGSENGTPYWLVANSWTTSWGDAGYFKIKRGTNECGIESDPVAGIPKVN